VARRTWDHLRARAVALVRRLLRHRGRLAVLDPAPSVRRLEVLVVLVVPVLVVVRLAGVAVDAARRLPSSRPPVVTAPGGAGDVLPARPVRPRSGGAVVTAPVAATPIRSAGATSRRPLRPRTRLAAVRHRVLVRVAAVAVRVASSGRPRLAVLGSLPIDG
jgi:hypothetical protein